MPAGGIEVVVALRQGDLAQLAEATARFADQLPQFIDGMGDALREQPLETTVEELSRFFLSLGASIDMQSSLGERLKAMVAELVQGNSAALQKIARASAAAFKAHAHKQKGELKEAAAAIGLAIQLDPGDQQFLLVRAELRQQLGWPQEALEDLEHAVRLAPQSAEVFSRRGSLQCSLGNIPLAIADFSRAIELEPSPWRFQMRGLLHRLEGRYPEALANLESAIALNPENLLLVFGRLPLQALMRNLEGVVETYARLAAQASVFIKQLQDSVVGPDPELHKTKILHWLLSSGLPFEATAELSERLTRIVRMGVEAGSRAIQADAASLRASLHRQKDEYPEALAAVNEALELDPGHAPHWLERAKTYRFMGRLTEALSDVGNAQALEPESGSLQFSCASMYLQMNRLEEGLAALDRGLTLEPGMTLARILRSRALMQGGRYGEALVEILRALEEEPGSHQALAIHSALSIVYERYAEALEDVEAIAAGDSAMLPDWPNIQGELLSRLGRYDEALQVYRQVVEKKPESWRATYNLAVTRARLEGPEAVGEELAEAQRRLQDLLQKDRSEALVRLGGIEALTGSVERAFELLKEAVSLDRHIIHWAKGDLAWGRLRQDPRFQTLLGPLASG